jgi:uncharacterized protein (DUF433 family)
MIGTIMTQTRPARSRSFTVTIPEELGSVIDDAARRSGRDAATVASEMLSEAARMRRHSGIVFSDGPHGRVAQLVGTGVAVHDIIGKLNYFDGDLEALRNAYASLSEQELRTALAYGGAFPEEIAAILDAEDLAALEDLWTHYPVTRPPWR